MVRGEGRQTRRGRGVAVGAGSSRTADRASCWATIQDRNVSVPVHHFLVDDLTRKLGKLDTEARVAAALVTVWGDSTTTRELFCICVVKTTTCTQSL